MGLLHSFLSACQPAARSTSPPAQVLKEGISHPYPLAPTIHGRPISIMRDSPSSSSTSGSTWPAGKRIRGRSKSDSASASVPSRRPILRPSGEEEEEEEEVVVEQRSRQTKRPRPSLDTRVLPDAPHTTSPDQLDPLDPPGSPSVAGRGGAAHPHSHSTERSLINRQSVRTLGMASLASSSPAGGRNRRKLHKTRMVEGDWDLIQPCDLTDPAPRFSLSLGLGGAGGSGGVGSLGSYSRLGSD